jgi:hypothetical protein
MDPNDPDFAEYDQLMQKKVRLYDEGAPSSFSGMKAVDDQLGALADRRAAQKAAEDDVARAMGEDPDPPWQVVDPVTVDPDSEEGRAARDAAYWDQPVAATVDVATGVTTLASGETIQRDRITGTLVFTRSDGTTSSVDRDDPKWESLRRLDVGGLDDAS